MKKINLIEMLQGCSKRNGTTFRQSNPDGQPTVNRQSRLMSRQGWFRNLAMIFAVLVLSMANIGTAWADTEATISPVNNSSTAYFSPDGIAVTAISGTGGAGFAYNSGTPKITVQGIPAKKVATIAFTIADGVTITSFKVNGTKNNNSTYALDGAAVTFGTALSGLSKTGSMSFTITCTDGTSSSSNRNTEISSFALTYTTSGGGGGSATGTATITYVLDVTDKGTTLQTITGTGVSGVNTVSATTSTTLLAGGLGTGGSHNSDKNKHNGTRTLGINTLSEETASKYFYVTFNVASGYQITPTAISLKALTIGGNNTSYKAVLTDGAHSITGTVNATSDTEVTLGSWSGLGSTALTGTVTLKLYAWYTKSGTYNAYRLTTPITITGTVAEAAACSAPTSAAVEPTNTNGWRYSTGETIDLTCTAEGGTGTKTYQWQKYIGSTWTDINTATNASAGTAHLQIANCTSSDGGSYQCVVSTGDGCSLTSNEYRVYVFTLDGNYYGGGDWVKHPIVWNGDYTGTVTLSLTESSTFMYKVTNNDGKWYGGTSGNFLVLPAARDHYTDQSADIRLFTGPAGDYTFTIDITHFNDYPGTPYVNISVAYPTVSHPASGYAYFKKWNDWSGYYIHWWYNDGSDHPLSAWGSDPQVTTETTICGTDYIYFPVLDTYNKLIVKDAVGNASHTTGDLSSVGSSGKYFDFTNDNAWNTFTTYTVTTSISPAGYGTVSAASVTGVACGTSISASTNTLSVGATNVTATSASATAEYTYAFDNWTWTPAGSAVTSDVTATANFTRTPKSYTLTWNLAGGKVTVAGTGAAVNATGTPNSEVAFGTDISAPTVTKTGYNFSAWSPSVASTMPAANTTYTATWTEKTTTITISANTANHGSTAPSSITATYGSALPSFTAATGASGYNLTGYFTAATGGTKVINADGTLVASTDYADGSGKWKYETSTLTLYPQYEEEVVSPSKCITFNDALATHVTASGTTYDGVTYTYSLKSTISTSDGANLKDNDNYLHLDIASLGTINKVVVTIKSIGSANQDSKGIKYGFGASSITPSLTRFNFDSGAELELTPASGTPTGFKVQRSGTSIKIEEICIYYTPAACTSVAAPTSLSCSAQTSSSLTFTWTKAANASGYTATLYSDAGCTSSVSSQDLGDENTVTFNTLTANTTYYCKVQSKGDGSTYCAAGGTTTAQSGTTDAACSAHELAYATASVEKNVGDAAFTNTLTNPHNLVVTYSSNATGVATVNATSGLVSIVGAGSTTITATWAGDGTYCAGTATYTLTVSSGCTPQSLSKAVLTSATEAAVTGYNDNQYAGEAVLGNFTTKNSSTNTAEVDGSHEGEETGYKMYTSGSKLFAALKSGTFRESDQIKVTITKINDAYKVGDDAQTILDIYYDASSPKLLHTIESVSSIGTYTYTLTASDITALGSVKTIGVYRPSSGRTQNPYVYSVEIVGCREWATCEAPDVVAASGATHNSALLTVTDAAATGNYEFYYSTSSTAPTASTAATATGGSLTKTITGLSANTTYYYWVRSNCGGVTKSAWVAGTPTTFATTAAPSTYSVTYNGNGKTDGDVPTDDTDYEEGDVVTVLGNTGGLEKDGQTFLGWSTSSTASTGTFYPAGYKFVMPANNVMLYAVWGSVGATCVTLTHFESSNHSKSNNKPDSRGYYFYGYKGSVSTDKAVTITTGSNNNKGFNSATDYMRFYYGSSVYIYADNTTTSGTPASFEGITSISLKIKLKKTAPTLTIKVGSTTIANAVSLSSANTSSFTTYTYENLADLDGVIQITNNGSGDSNYEIYLDDIQICYGSGASSGYTVSFDMKDHGSAIADIENIPSGSKIGAPVPAPTATDWDFGGWYKETGCTNAWNFESDQVTSNTTLYAKWSNCAPTITTDPVSANYNQNGVASALTVEAATNGGGDLHYQWWMKENDLADEDGSVIPGETDASFTPSTELLGTSYYYCVVSNDCGNVKTNTAAVTIRDAKPDPKAIWTVQEPTHGGKGFTFSVEVNKDDDDNWDGTLTADMLSVSSEAVLGTVTVNDKTKTISGTYGVKASATSPVTFYLLLPATATQAAARLDHDQSFAECAGAGSGTTYNIPMLSAYSSTSSGKPTYHCATAGVGYIAPEVGSSSVTLKAEGYDEFSYYTSSGRQSVLVYSEKDAIKKMRIYLLASGGPASVKSVGTKTGTYSTNTSDYVAFRSDDYDVTYTDEDGNDGIGKSSNGYIELTFATPLEEGTFVYVVLEKNAKFFGAKLIESEGGGTGETQSTTLAWASAPYEAPATYIEKDETALNFTYTATRSGANAEASLGTIVYYSGDESVATVNASTGEVSIADDISWGDAIFKDVTITAMLSASGCYEKAELSYTVRVKRNVCEDAQGTIAVTSSSCSSWELAISGYAAGATISWYKEGTVAAVKSGSGSGADTYSATTAGTYYAVTNATCEAISTNEIKVSFTTATATKIVDEWYVKNDRRTPDIALVQTTNATGFTVTTGSPASDITSTGIGGCTFELKEDGIIYLHGTTSTGAAPSGMTPGDMTITITATACSNAAPLDIVLHIQPETAKPTIAFVVDGTLRKDGGTATSVLEAKTSERPIWKYLANTFALTGCNAYWSVDSKELRQYYSQFDAILITDDPSTDTKGTGGVSYVKAFGTMVDVRPVLTMEAYVGKFKDGGWHVYDATPTSPNPRQVEMKLECKNHDIFKGLNPATSDNVRTTTDESGNEYWHVIMVDTTQSPYHNTKDSYEALPALQGFDRTKFSNMLGVGTIFEEKLQGGVERQEEPAARMMILGIQNNAMGALTNEGKLIVKNALEYLLKTNMEDVNDCANYFTNADGDGRWDNGANWTRGEVPDFETRARILQPVTISDGTTAIAARVDIAANGESKHLGQRCNGSITIEPQGILKVGGKVTRAKAPYFGIDNLQPTQPEDLYLKTNTSNQSALIFDNEEGETQAVVQVYSKAHKDGDNRYWQYLTSPLMQAPVTEFFYGIGTYTFKYDEAQNGWVRYNLGTTFEAFDAIGLTQNETKNFVFYGPLASTEDRELNLTNEYNGENMFGNSWTAPLQLTQFDDDDFEGDIERTFYVYNTGFDAEKGTGAHTNASNTPGEWQSIPLSSLEVLTGVGAWEGLKVVPAYQAFYVKCTSAGTITLNYDKHVRPATHDVNESLRAPKRAMSVKMDVLGMRISVENTSRRSSIYLLEDEDFTEGFDNGWDGDYFSGDANVSRFYSVSPLGRMAVSALPNLDGTALGFEPASMNEEYTFTFYCDEDKYYLNDLKMETSTPIRTGESYTFMSEEGDGANRFYISATPFASPQITTGSENLDAAAPKVQKIIYNDKLYIIRGGKVYSADGQVVK